MARPIKKNVNMKILFCCVTWCIVMMCVAHTSYAQTPPTAAVSTAAPTSSAPVDKKALLSDTPVDLHTYSAKVDPNAVVCTILSGRLDLLNLSYVLDIFSTYKVEKNCSPHNYQRLTIASVAAQLRTTGASHVIRGGYHHYLMDVNTSPVNNPYYFLGNLKFSKTGFIRLELWPILRGLMPGMEELVLASFVPFEVSAQINYVWNVGTLAHILISPEGKYYLMYAFTNNVKPELTREGLTDIAKTMQLPPGWKYQNRLLSKTVSVRTTPVSGYRLNFLFDELQNYYVESEELY